MNRHLQSCRKATAQRGYALLMVMFLVTLLLITVMAAAPSVKTEGQREKEQEMIWRGKQYIRGIKLFYRKTGRFPTSLDDLTKPKTGSMRFMRQAYKDPMNATDGSWRLIYVGPSGQLIGSLKPPQTFQLPGLGGAPPAGAPQANSAFGGSNSSQSASAQSGTQQQPAGGAAQQGANSSNSAAGGSAPADDAANATPSGLVNTDSPVMGGNIIGVGSKVNKRSVIVYDKAKNYRLFEFIWNPSKDLANALNANGVPVATPVQKGQGTGQTPGTGDSNQPPPNAPSMPPPTPPPSNPPQD